MSPNRNELKWFKRSVRTWLRLTISRFSPLSETKAKKNEIFYVEAAALSAFSLRSRAAWGERMKRRSFRNVTNAVSSEFELNIPEQKIRETKSIQISFFIRVYEGSINLK